MEAKTGSSNSTLLGKTKRRHSMQSPKIRPKDAKKESKESHSNESGLKPIKNASNKSNSGYKMDPARCDDGKFNSIDDRNNKSKRKVKGSKDIKFTEEVPLSEIKGKLVKDNINKKMKEKIRLRSLGSIPVNGTSLTPKKSDSGDTKTTSLEHNGKKLSSPKSDEIKFKNKRKVKFGKDIILNEKEVSFDEIERKIFEGIDEKSICISRNRAQPSNNGEHLDSLNKRKSSKVKPSSTSKASPDLTFKREDKAYKKESKLPETKDSNRKKNKESDKTKVKANKKPSTPKTSQSSKIKLPLKNTTASSSDSSDWEEVDELSEIMGSGEKSNAGVHIELESSNILWGVQRRKRRSEQQMIEDYLRKQVNKSVREVHENMHKTHLLCLLAHGMFINSLLCSDNLLSSALSILSKSYFSPKRLDISHLEKFLAWFCKSVSVCKKQPEASVSENVSMESKLEERFETKSPFNNEELVYMFVIITRAIGMNVRLIKNLNPLSWKPPMDSLIRPRKEQEEKQELPSTSSQPPTNPLPKSSVQNKKSKKMLSTDSEAEKEDLKIKSKKKKLKKKANSDEEDFEDSLEFSKPCKGKPSKEGSKSLKRRNSEEVEGSKKQRRQALEEWAEVYVEEEEKWISIDVTRAKIHCVAEIEARCPNASYIVAFNPDQSLKDVTRRYVSSWLSCSSKIQFDAEWWSAALRPFRPPRSGREKAEEKQLDQSLRSQPLPKTINEYKNHPMYALKRHLLKFEAIYPEDAAPLGHVRGEAVFRRSQVKALHGRELWLKEAKTVRLGEEPYKVVKSRPKWDRGTGQAVDAGPLELFGEWQVEDYEPPVAQGGKVPRNPYGNVELFKPCMVPRGCVHLPVSGLGRLARKLEVDSAPALVGFEYHRGGSHPVYDGVVVCEEFRDILMDAWNQEEVERAKKEVEKRTKRIYGNWKRLIHGLTLKERMRERYGVGGDKEGGGKEEVGGGKEEEGGGGKEEEGGGGKKSKRGRKVTQEDLSALPTCGLSYSSHLKIDLSGPVKEDRGRRGRKRGRGAARGQPAPLSSDSEDDGLTSQERAEKIRSILRWNPEEEDAHALSDLSDEEEAPSLDGKRTRWDGGGKAPLKRSPPAHLEDSSSGSEGCEEAVPRPRPRPRPRRSATNPQPVQDDVTSGESDVTLGESDVSDKTYDPSNEI